MNYASLAVVALLLATSCHDARGAPRRSKTPATQQEHAAPTATHAAAPPPSPSRPVGGPCPAPDERELLAFRTARKFANTVGPAVGRLKAEAVRVRLSRLVAQGCAHGATAKKLHEAVLELEPEDQVSDPESAVLAGLWLDRRPRAILIAGGYGWVALFHERDTAVEMAMVVTDEGTAMEQQLLLLDAEVFWPASAKQPMLAVSSTHPWYASCWRDMRFRVFRPGNHAHHPVVVLERASLGGYWCSGSTISVLGDRLTIRYDNWTGPLNRIDVQRPYVAAFRHEGDALHETFGFAPGAGDRASSVFAHLVEDWLRRDWKLSREATTARARSRLEPVHGKLHARKLAGEFSVQLHSEGADARRLTVFCNAEDSQLPCETWPVPIDFHLSRQKGLWFVSDVRERLKR